MRALTSASLCAIAIAICSFATSSSTRAEPPSGADPSLAHWFENLKQPGNGLPCCSISDCRFTDTHAGTSGYEALIEGVWFTVPNDTVLDHMDNPTGRAIVCYHRFYADDGQLGPITILCFVRPTES